jgi:hypothetical protein
VMASLPGTPSHGMVLRSDFLDKPTRGDIVFHSFQWSDSLPWPLKNGGKRSPGDYYSRQPNALVQCHQALRPSIARYVSSFLSSAIAVRPQT